MCTRSTPPDSPIVAMSFEVLLLHYCQCAVWQQREFKFQSQKADSNGCASYGAWTIGIT
jgi:hypothetical protein